MKKILVAVFLIGAIGATSCKKDVEATPSKNLKINGGPDRNLEKTDVGSWD